MSTPGDLTHFETEEALLKEAERRLESGDLDSESSRRAYQDLLELYRTSCREKQRLLEATLASLTDGVAIFDARGCLRIGNPLAASLLDAPSALKRGAWRYADLAAALIDAGASITIGLERDTSRSPSDEIRFPDGRVVQIRRSRMPDGGEIHVYVDVTAERQRARALSEAQALAEAAAQARTEFLAVMSHEIRTPLNGMLGMAQLALGLVRDPELKGRLEAIRYAGDAVLAILNDILEFSRLDAGAPSFEARSFDLRRTVDSTISLMSSRAKEKGLRLDVCVAPDVPRYLVGDDNRLRQVLLNLVGNGVKFTDAGTVRLDIDMASGADGRAGLRFVVADTGVGIAPEIQRRLFDSLTEADVSIARRFSGVGLGLAICKRIVELQGGRIGLESAIGEGTHFWFELDFGVAPVPSAAEERRPQQIPSRPLSILLAEDDPISQLVGVGLLERFGHQVEAVGDGRPAVDAVAAGRRFDVILMDLFMPTMDGVAAARAIRSLPAGQRDVPIVALTASTVSADVDAAIAAGMNAVVTKPFDPARLNVVLAQVTSEPPVAAAADDAVAVPPDCDAAVIKQLHGAMGQDAVTLVMQSFLNALERNAEDVEAMLAVNPAHALFLAHRLAGSAAVFGLRRLSDGLLEVEQALRAGEIARARAQLNRIPDLASAAMQRLSEAA